MTAAGKVVDVALEMWTIFVVTATAGSFASFRRRQLSEPDPPATLDVREEAEERQRPVASLPN